MAKLGSITINEIEMIEVDASPLVDGFDAPSGSLAILTDGTGLFLKTEGGPTSWQNLGAFGGTTDHTALTNLTTGDAGHTQFVMTDGSKAMTGALSITAASNQLSFSSGTNQLILTSGTSVAARTYTIPDMGPTATFAMLVGAQTFTGAKTFSNTVNLSALVANQVLRLDASKNIVGTTLTNGQFLTGITGSAPVAGSLASSTEITPTFANPNWSMALNTTGVTAATYGSTTQVPQIAVDSKGRVTSASNVTITPANIGAQPVDSTLTSLAAYNTNGILTQTAADTFTGRTITGTAGQIDVANGNGVAGNPTISLPNVGTAATYGSNLQIPVITTDAQGRVSSVVNTSVDVQLGGDVTSTLASDTVISSIRGNAVSAGTPLVGQAYIWNGTSFVPDDVDVKSARRTRMFDDFIGASAGTGTVGEFGWTVTSNGTNATLGILNSLGTDDFGVIAPTTGTTATGRNATYLNVGAVIMGGGEISCEMRVRIPILSDGTNTYTFRIGLGDNTAAGDHADGVYFEYNSTVSASNWLLKTANNNTRTQVTSTGIVAGNTWQRLKFITNAIGSSTDFYVDDVLVGTIGTNHPVAVGRQTGPMMKIEKSVGTTNRQVYVDYYVIEKKFTTSR